MVFVQNGKIEIRNVRNEAIRNGFVDMVFFHQIIGKRKRRAKLTSKEKNLIVRWTKDKSINLVSAKEIQRKFNSLSKTKKEKNRKKRCHYLLLIEPSIIIIQSPSK